MPHLDLRSWEDRISDLDFILLARSVSFFLAVAWLSTFPANPHAQVKTGKPGIGCYNAREELCEPCGRQDHDMPASP